MESRAEKTVRARMEELRSFCSQRISAQQQKLDSAVASFRNSLDSNAARAHETVENQVILGKLKADLREAEDSLVKAIADKTRKEAKRMAMVDSISSTKARNEELKRITKDQRTRKDEYAAILHQQSLALEKLEEKSNQDIEQRGGVQEAIAWYKKVLGLRIDGGHGVKFTFTDINFKNPMEEYSFTIRLENDIYTLLDCSCQLNDIKELIHELNRTNGLFKFVRIMREKFQKAAVSGLPSQLASLDQECSVITLSAPVSSVSTDSRSETPTKQSKPIVQAGKSAKQFKKTNANFSVRRSPRFEVKKS